MAKGLAIKFKSYPETVYALLNVLKLSDELKKHEKIIIKPSLKGAAFKNSSVLFVEEVLKFCLEHKNPEAEVFIAEGADYGNTEDLFDRLGYTSLSEKYAVGLIDLNSAFTEEIESEAFIKFKKISYPSILRQSFVISLANLSEDQETVMYGSLANMIGAFPAKKYRGLFSRFKNKIREWPIKYAIHDSLVCKMPELAIIDASESGYLLAGNPLEVDKNACKLLKKDWKEVPYLKLLSDSFSI